MEEAPFFPLAPQCGRHRSFPLAPRQRGEGKWGRHRSFPLAPRQRGEGARRAGEGPLAGARKEPLIRPSGAPSPRSRTGRREMGAAPFRGTFSPSARGEGKWRRHRSFPSPRDAGGTVLFPSPRDSGERVPEGRVRGWSSLQRSSFSSAPPGHLPRQHGEKGNGSRVPALACPSFSSTWEAYTTSLGKTKRYPTPISVERLFEMRRVCRNW